MTGTKPSTRHIYMVGKFLWQGPVGETYQNFFDTVKITNTLGETYQNFFETVETHHIPGGALSKIWQNPFYNDRALWWALKAFLSVPAPWLKPWAAHKHGPINEHNTAYQGHRPRKLASKPIA